MRGQVPQDVHILPYKPQVHPFATYAVYLANVLFLQKFFDVLHRIVIEKSVTDKNHLAIFPVQKLFALFRLHHNRLFNQNVFTSVHRLRQKLKMGGGGGRYHDILYLFIIKNTLRIGTKPAIFIGEVYVFFLVAGDNLVKRLKFVENSNVISAPMTKSYHAYFHFYFPFNCG